MSAQLTGGDRIKASSYSRGNPMRGVSSAQVVKAFAAELPQIEDRSPVSPLASRELRSRQRMQVAIDTPTSRKSLSRLSTPSVRSRSRTAEPPETSPLPVRQDEEDGRVMPISSPSQCRGVWAKLEALDREERDEKQRLLKARSASAQRPDPLAELENKVQSEMNVLMSAPDPPSDRERLAVFQEAAHRIVPMFPTYGSLLERIFSEYDRYIESSAAEIRRVRMMEGELDELQREKTNETAILNAKMRQLDEKHQQQMRDLEERLRDGPALIEMVQEVDTLKIRVNEEKNLRVSLQDRLGSTAMIKREFERVLRNVEETFRTLVDDKDLQISKLTNEVYFARAAIAEIDDRARQEGITMRHRLDTLTIANELLRQRETVLSTRVRDLEQLNNRLQDKVQTSNLELDALEERLAQFEGIPNFPQKDVVMTPRPNRGEAFKNIPELGDVTQFHSTIALMNAIYERYSSMSNAVKAHEQIMINLNKLVSDKLNTMEKRVRDDFQRARDTRHKVHAPIDGIPEETAFARIESMASLKGERTGSIFCENPPPMNRTTSIL